jgi:uncharacterized membrane protein
MNLFDFQRRPHIRAAILILGLALSAVLPARAAGAAVRAVLFYSPNCGHCHYVIEEVLLPMGDQYGDRLQIVGIDITDPGGRALYEETLDYLSIPENHMGVPMLLVSDVVLVGSAEIPERFPGMVEAYLTGGGTDWPDVPGLVPVLVANGLMEDEAPSAPTPESGQPVASADSATTAESTVAPAATAATGLPATTVPATAIAAQPEAAVAAPEASAPAALALETAAAPAGAWDRVRLDPVGNSLSILVLAGMIAAVVYAAARLWQARARGADVLSGVKAPGVRRWAVAALCAVGLGVSAYMAYVETTHTAAVCGPVGDCNTVQQSAYASLFGVLPIGVMGMLGYGLMLIAWAAVAWGRAAVRPPAGWVLLGGAFFGTLFSIYLTFLEPFVIGASCAWCLTSAVVMTLILLLCVPGAQGVKAEAAVRAAADA